MATIVKNVDGSASVKLTKEETKEALRTRKHRKQWDELPPGAYAAEHGR